MNLGDTVNWLKIIEVPVPVPVRNPTSAALAQVIIVKVRTPNIVDVLVSPKRVAILSLPKTPKSECRTNFKLIKL